MFVQASNQVRLSPEFGLQVQVIAGLQNFDAKKVAAVVSAAEKVGMQRMTLRYGDNSATLIWWLNYSGRSNTRRHRL